jgi:hypothetical protein
VLAVRLALVCGGKVCHLVMSICLD